MAPGCNRTDGPNVAEVPLQITAPVTLTPLEDSPKVVDVSVEQSIAALKVTWVTAVNATPVAPLAGLVETTVGGEPLPLPLLPQATNSAQRYKGREIQPHGKLLLLGVRRSEERPLSKQNTGGGARFTLWTLSVGCETDGQKRAEFQKLRWGRDRRPAASELAASVHCRQVALLADNSISTSGTIAALVSVVASLWIGLALLMAGRYGTTLPADARRGTRLVFGAVTFFLWYATMLSGMSILAMLTVRTFRELSTTVLVLLALTALLWCTRRLMRRVLVKGAPSGAMLGDRERTSKR